MGNPEIQWVVDKPSWGWILEAFLMAIHDLQKASVFVFFWGCPWNSLTQGGSEPRVTVYDVWQKHKKAVERMVGDPTHLQSQGCKNKVWAETTLLVSRFLWRHKSFVLYCTYSYIYIPLIYCTATPKLTNTKNLNADGFFGTELYNNHRNN